MSEFCEETRDRVALAMVNIARECGGSRLFTTLEDCPQPNEWPRYYKWLAEQEVG